jgi:hypothetical protein
MSTESKIMQFQEYGEIDRERANQGSYLQRSMSSEERKEEMAKAMEGSRPKDGYLS